MLEHVKRNWQEFMAAEPGCRFVERYWERQCKSQGKFNCGKIFNIVGGLIVALAGIFFIPAPGPGTLILVAGLGLIGSECLPLARALDWAEVRLRAIADRALMLWKQTPLPVKVAVSLLVLAGAASIAYGAYKFFLGDFQMTV
jgi:hypothetical protein